MNTLFTEDLYTLITIVVCLILSALFSASETAISSIGVIRAKHLLDSKGRSARPLHLWVKKPHHILTTILLFNNLVNILASVLTAYLTAKYFESNSIGIATGIITLLILIFGEIIPKSFAKIYSDKVSMLALRIINPLYYICFPVVWIFAEMAYVISRYIGGEKKHAPLITEDEIEYLINGSEHSTALSLEETKRSMISSVFEFHETKVREIMTPRTDLIAIDIDDASISKVLKVIQESGHSRIPIYQDRIDNIVGVILAKDLLLLNSKSRHDIVIKDTLRQPCFVPESKAIMEVFKDLRTTKNHLAIVVDEYGGTAGIVSMEDILEEIVGDIQDEHDREEEEITKINDRVFDISGSLNIGNFFDHFSDSKDNEEVEKLSAEFDTIGGWVTDLMGDLPKTGQKVTHEPFELEITKVDHHRIKRVRVKLIDPDLASDHGSESS